MPKAPESRKKMIWIGMACLLLLFFLMAGAVIYGEISPIFHSTVAVVEADEQDLAVLAVASMQEKPQLSLLEEGASVTTSQTDFALQRSFHADASSIPTAIYAREKIEEDVDNILLVLDGSFYLISDHPEKMQLVALESTTLLPVQGYGWTTLTASYELGGLPCVINTINQAFDLDINQYVFMNSEAIWQVSDKMGGLTVALTAAEASELNRLLGTAYTAGETVMWTGGLQAYTKLTVDGDAIAHWQTVCHAIVNKAKAEKQTKQLWKAARSSLSSNVSFFTLKAIGEELLQNSSLTQYNFPKTGAYKLLEGETVLDVDLNAGRTELHALLYS